MKQNAKPIRPPQETTRADGTRPPEASGPYPMTISIVRQFARVYHPDRRLLPAYSQAVCIN